MTASGDREGVKLGLGGHSYIAQLGNDPPASFEQQCALVAACLDAGIRLLDTTYYQERIALGRVLQHLRRRDEATVTGWNFFKQPGKDDELVAWTPYAPGHIDIMLEELQTDWIDLLVIHADDDPATLHRELALAEVWIRTGKVRQVGLGMAELRHLHQLPAHHPVTHVLAPYNAFNRDAAALFARARALGMRTIAMSPFIRGWKLQEIGDCHSGEGLAGQAQSLSSTQAGALHAACSLTRYTACSRLVLWHYYIPPTIWFALYQACCHASC